MAPAAAGAMIYGIDVVRVHVKSEGAQPFSAGFAYLDHSFADADKSVRDAAAFYMTRPDFFRAESALQEIDDHGRIRRQQGGSEVSQIHTGAGCDIPVISERVDDKRGTLAPRPVGGIAHAGRTGRNSSRVERTLVRRVAILYVPVPRGWLSPAAHGFASCNEESGVADFHHGMEGVAGPVIVPGRFFGAEGPLHEVDQLGSLGYGDVGCDGVDRGCGSSAAVIGGSPCAVQR